MTRLKKILVTGLLVLVSCCTYLGTAIANVAQSVFSFGSASAATFNNGNTNDSTDKIKQGNIMTVTKMPTTGTKGTEMELPYLADGDTVKGVAVKKVNDEGTGTGNVVDNPTIYVEIVDPYGKTLTKFTTGNKTEADDGQVRIDSNNKLYLKPAVSGMYKVRYHNKSNDGVWTSTNFYYIMVTADSYEIKFATNDSIVMPSTVRIDTENTTASWAKRDVSVALPLVYDESGKLIEDDIVLGDKFEEGGIEYNYVIKYEKLENRTLSQVSNVNSNVNTYKEYKTYTIRKVKAIECGTIEYKLTVSLGSSLLSQLTGEVDADAVVYDSVAYKFTALPGKNVVNYKLSKTAKPADVIAYYTYTVNGSKSYDSEHIKLTATPISNLKSSEVNYQEKVYLPKVNAVDANNSNSSVSAFYYYVIKAVDSQGNYDASSSKVVMGKDENGFYFIPSGDVNTRYEIYYNVKDFYGNRAEEDDNYDYEITVKDKKIDEYYYSSSYDFEDPDSAPKDDMTYAIPTKISNSTEQIITLPAIWAKDVSGITYVSRSINSSEKTFVKGDEKVSGTIYLTNDDGSTSQYGLGDVDVNEIVSFKNGDNVYYEVNAYNNNNYTLRKMAGATRNAETDPIVYYRDNNGNYRKTADGATIQESDPTVEKTEIRNFKNSCVVQLKVTSSLFGAGKYTFSVSIRDGANNSNLSNRTPGSFEVVEDVLTPSTPTVKFADSTLANVGDNQDIRFAIPEVKDDIDEKLLVKYYVQVGDNWFKEVKTSSDGKYIEFNTKDLVSDTLSLYNAALNNSINKNSFNIVAFAFNDFANYDITEEKLKGFDSLETSDRDKIGITKASYLITVKSKVADTTAPTFSVIDKSFSTVDDRDGQPKQTLIQNREVTVGGVTFYDDTNTATIKVQVTDTNGREYAYQDISSYITIEKAGDNYKYTFDGIKFVPSNADLGNYYTVTYTLVDEGDNVVSYSFVLVHAADRTAPIVSGIDGSTRTLELGEQLILTGITTTDTTLQANMKFRVECQNSEKLNFSQFARISSTNDRLEFKPDRPGTYTLKIYAIDEAENKSQPRELTVEVKDTLKPVIDLQGADSSNFTILEERITKDDASGKDVFPSAVVPRATISDALPTNSSVTLDSSVFGATGKITVTAPKKDKNNVSEYVFNFDGTPVNDAIENTIDFKPVGGSFEFTPLTRGQYTITYSGVDNNGNEAESKTYIVNVGDTEKPIIYLSSKLANKLANGFVLGENATLEINPNARIYGEAGYNLEDIYVEDNFGFETSIDQSTNVNYVKVSISITDPSGNTLTKEDSEDGKNHYKFEKQGTYTLTINVTDKNGNKSESFTKPFTVKAKTASSIDTTTIVGTVLIVVSSLILVGIIIYLVRGVKLLPKKNKKAKNKAKLDKKED